MIPADKIIKSSLDLLSFIDNEGELKTYNKDLCIERAFMMKLVFEDSKEK